MIREPLLIYSIGTSNRSLPEFVGAVRSYQITSLIDVRTSPSSRLPWFNRSMIERWAERASIFYRYEGAILGGRSHYAIDHPRYIEALNRVVEASKRERVAIFCAEGDPRDCHRSYDIAAALLVRVGIVVRHIGRDGMLEDATATLARTNPNVFSEHLRGAISTLTTGQNDLRF